MLVWVNPNNAPVVHLMNNWSGGTIDDGFFITVRFDAGVQYHQVRIEKFYGGAIREGDSSMYRSNYV